MDRRLQLTQDDAILEITEMQPVKTRLSESALLRRRADLLESIAEFDKRRAEVDAQLAMIAAAKNERATK